MIHFDNPIIVAKYVRASVYLNVKSLVNVCEIEYGDINIYKYIYI